MIRRYVIITGIAVLCSSLFTLKTMAQRVVSLEECVSSMRKGNIRAKNAQKNVQSAEEFRKYARSKYYPSLNLNAFHYEATDYLLRRELLSEEWSELIEELNNQYGLGLDTSIQAFKRGTSAGLSLLQPVYVGGRITNVNKLADLQVDAMKMVQDVDDDMLVMEAELMYFTLLKLHGKRRVLDASDVEVGSILKDARNLAAEGIVNSNDALNVELTQNQLQAQRVRLDNAIKLLRRALAKEMGVPNEDIDVDTVLTSKGIVPPQTLWMDSGMATDNRNESRLLDLNVQRTQLQTKIAKASYLPIVAVGGNFGVSRFLTKTNTRGMAYAVLAMPLSTFWSERHMVKRSKIEEQKALDERKDKRELLDLQVRDAYDNLSAAYKQVEIAKKSVGRAEENLRIKHEEYINGVCNMTTLLDAQRQKSTANDALTDATCDYHHAKTKYLIMTGRKELTY
jgi:outer membrane protein TolC